MNCKGKKWCVGCTFEVAYGPNEDSKIKIKRGYGDTGMGEFGIKLEGIERYLGRSNNGNKF